MADANPSVSQKSAFCRDCGEEIREEAEICPNCGIRQKDYKQGTDPDSTTFTNQYSVFVWIASIIFAIITFPLGLIIPAYFIIKAKNGTGIEQGGWETWTVVLAGLIGIIAVELGGEKGAKILWGIVVLLIGFIIFAAILGTFILGLGSSAANFQLSLV